MSIESKEIKKRRGGIDPAALAAASLAAAVAVIAPPGPYGPGSIPIGITILLLITSYDIDPYRSRGQSLAYAAVVALVAILALGFPLECIFSSDPVARLTVLMKERKEEIPYSEVPPLVSIGAWLFITVVVCICDRRRVKRN